MGLFGGLLAGVAGNIASNKIEDAANTVGDDISGKKLPVPVAGENQAVDIGVIRGILEELISRSSKGRDISSIYFDVPSMLLGSAPVDILDPRPYGFTQVALYSPTAVTAQLVLNSGATVNINLPAAKFVAIQQPESVRIQLSTVAGTSQSIVVRYSDEVYGAVVP